MGLAPILWFEQTEDFLAFVQSTNTFSRLTVPLSLRQAIAVKNEQNT